MNIGAIKINQNANVSISVDVKALKHGVQDMVRIK
jgi:hypothetical protein